MNRSTSSIRRCWRPRAFIQLHLVRIATPQLCRELREIFHFEGVVVIYSANDEDESKEMAVAAGADGLIGKGVGKGLQMLHDTIAKWYERRFGDDSFKQ